MIPASERIRVVTKAHKHVDIHEYWIDVRSPHPLGNPRAFSIAMYRYWLQDRIDARDVFVMNALYTWTRLVADGGRLALFGGAHAGVIRSELLFRLDSRQSGRWAEAYMRDVLAKQIAKQSSRTQRITVGEIRAWLAAHEVVAAA